MSDKRITPAQRKAIKQVRKSDVFGVQREREAFLRAAKRPTYSGSSR